jgi:penicillin G amidase
MVTKGVPAAVMVASLLMSAPVAADMGEEKPAAVSATDATIYRDRFGVPHIFADTAPTLFFGATYAIAQDRLAQAELEGRRQLGRMAELFGPDLVESDKAARLDAYTDAELKAQLDRFSPADQAIFRAMHQGWIAYVREVRANPALLPYEFKEWGIQPSEWTLWEYLAIMGGIGRDYGSGGGGFELTNLAFYRDMVKKHGEAKAKAIFDDVLPLQDPDATPFLPDGAVRPSGVAAQAPSAATFAEQTALPLSRMPAPRATPVRGASRAMLISAAKSSTGNPMILQATADGPDMHISGAGFDAAGYVFASSSPVIQGRTPTFGWSITTGEADNVDIFAEKLNPANRRQYMHKGAWRDMAVRRETIAVKGAAPVTFEVERTVHGPVVEREDAANIAYARQNSVAGHELDNLLGVLNLNRAKTLEDYKRAASQSSGSSNVNYAGVDGHVAVLRTGLQPIRQVGADPRLPRPGTGEHDWKGMVDPSDYLFSMDPAQGYFHVWNNKPTRESSYGDTARYGKGFRTWLGRSLVEGKDKVSPADLAEFHRQMGRSFGGTDLSVTNPRFFTPYLKAAVAGDARLEAVVAAMDSWNALYEDNDGDAFYDNPGLTIYREWIGTAQQQIIGDDAGDWWRKIDQERYIKYRQDVLLRAVEGKDAGAPMSYDWFNGQDRNAVLRRTVATTADALQKRYGSADPKTWRLPIFHRYYNVKAIAGNPKHPPYFPGANAHPERTLAAGRLGLQPASIPLNGSENWNMLLEVKREDTTLYDSTPIGGQNLTITADGKGNANIADQVKLHQTFTFKPVALDRARVMREAVSTKTVRMPAN